MFLINAVQFIIGVVLISPSPQRPVQERRHLTPRYVIMGAESGVALGRVAPAGHTSRRKLVNGALEDAAVVPPR